MSEEVAKDIIFSLTGIHSSGKTTIGTLLAQEGFSYHPEIAAMLIERGEARWIEGSTVSTEEFQRSIMQEELRRETAALSTGVHVVETFHPGNLAHCLLICPDADVTRHYREHAQHVVREKRVIGIHLNIDIATLLTRTQLYKGRQIDTSFYAKLGPAIQGVYQELGMTWYCINSRGTIENTLERVRGIIQGEVGKR